MPQERVHDMELAERFADVARVLLAEQDAEATMNRISRLAVETIEGCDHAGITLVEGRKVTTAGASDEVPTAVDAIQYETDDGPCLNAIREHVSIKSDDLLADGRWPNFSCRAAEETGVRSMLSFRLFIEDDTMGALNLYSKQQRAFDDDALAVGAVFATHAAVALSSARHDEHMQAAVAGRDLIGQAKGILMAQQNVGADEAFDILRRASQRTNSKLREVAARLVERPPLPPRPDRS